MLARRLTGRVICLPVVLPTALPEEVSGSLHYNLPVIL